MGCGSEPCTGAAHTPTCKGERYLGAHGDERVIDAVAHAHKDGLNQAPLGTVRSRCHRQLPAGPPPARLVLSVAERENTAQVPHAHEQTQGRQPHVGVVVGKCARQGWLGRAQRHRRGPQRAQPRQRRLGIPSVQLSRSAHALV
jgi:hypothetical protein